MRVCIWYELIKGAWGGSNSFLLTLTDEFSHLGIKVDHSPSIRDSIVLVNSWSRGKGRYLDIDMVKNIRKTGFTSIIGHIFSQRGTPIIHRVNGVAQWYGRQDPRADTIQFAIAQMADYVIFQSHYSRESFGKLGIKPIRSTVIHNAVDSRIFYPPSILSEPKKNLKIAAISWSSNPMKGFSWLTRIAALPAVQVHFIGNWQPCLDPGNVKCMGVKTRIEIAELLRNSDILIHPAENDPCSNAIIEGLACALPILYHNSGGNPELAGDFGLPLTENLQESIEEIRLRYREFRHKALEARHRFRIETCAEKYVHVFEETAE